ncbi:hypothetical protein CERSUDRAFT_66377 [Gelatoporia subvermispora B]|uniref:MAGE domain-containing protein n=1 Tax=Ceriporiopsis subvermispora (strain B) TaxID=914234 RepID=M2QVA3_CERS8|nr:hypothetical protein CERSUDRAFT_66377 [Gelatoporia subvermispora B]
MPRPGTRSQPQLSQSQLRKAPNGQSQRTRRGRVEVEDEGPSQVNGHDEDEDMDREDGAAKGPDELQRAAYDLVRLALFSEQRRSPLKREEISKKVLGTNSRAFNAVFALAQGMLIKTFGMELVELQSNAKEDEEAAKLMKHTGIKKRAAPTGTKNYILRSTLDPALIELANAPDPDLLAEERAEYEDAEGVDDLDLRSSGSILAWNTADHLDAVGILHIILALILVEGRVLSDNDFRALLKRLSLSPTSPIPLAAHATKRAFSMDDYLKDLLKQGFLERTKVGEPARAGGKRGRVAASQGGPDEQGAVEWRWGPRAHSEIGEKAVARFVAEFMVERPAAEDDDAERRPRRREEDPTAKKRMEFMMRGIERAASGNPLSDVR